MPSGSRPSRSPARHTRAAPRTRFTKEIDFVPEYDAHGRSGPVVPTPNDLPSPLSLPSSLSRRGRPNGQAGRDRRTIHEGWNDHNDYHDDDTWVEIATVCVLTVVLVLVVITVHRDLVEDKIVHSTTMASIWAPPPLPPPPSPPPFLPLPFPFSSLSVVSLFKRIFAALTEA